MHSADAVDAMNYCINTLETAELIPHRSPKWTMALELDPPKKKESKSSFQKILATATDIQQTKARFVYFQIQHTGQCCWEWFRETASTESLFNFCDKYVSPDNKDYILVHTDAKTEADKIIRRHDKPVPFTEKRFSVTHRLHFLLCLSDE